MASVNAGNEGVVKWLPIEVVVDNPTDIQVGNNVFTVLNSSYYQFSGSINFLPDIADTDYTPIVLALQKSTDGGVSWMDFYATSVPIENYISNKVQTIPIPRFVHYLNANSKIRMVLYKPSELDNLGISSGIFVNNTGDQEKSFRITLIPQ